MHVSQIIFMAFLVAAYVAGWFRAPRKMLGGTIGGVLGVLIPFLCSVIYVRRGGDPTAAGALSFICILTLPLGIAIGVLVASWTAKGNGVKVTATLPNEKNPRAPRIELKGKIYNRIPNKEEKPETYVCLDCEAADGQIHELGCDAETCPRCGGQLLSCGCCGKRYEWAGID